MQTEERGVSETRCREGGCDRRSRSRGFCPSHYIRWRKTAAEGELDPVKAVSGRRGAIKRWGDGPRLVRLDGLTYEQRVGIVELVEAVRVRQTPRRLDSFTPEQQRLILALIRAGNGA
jgi:hypothetical protein